MSHSEQNIDCSVTAQSCYFLIWDHFKKKKKAELYDNYFKTKPKKMHKTTTKRYKNDSKEEQQQDSTKT